MRKTKIICTLGPATDNGDILRQLMLGGMNVCRFNFSHGDHEEHKKRLDAVVALREELGLPIATLLDTKGPEIRTGTFDPPKVELVQGQKFTLTTRDIVGSSNISSISFAGLPKDVKPGQRILIDDGLIELTVDSTTDTEIFCTVVNGGTVSNNKGINVPGIRLSMPYLSERDISDIMFGVQCDYDFIAASFVRSAADVMQIRALLDKLHCNNIKIISKIENSEGVDNIDEILRVSDGIMIARGDLGVEIPLQEIPIIQKKLIDKAYKAGKMVITATQMLDSMMKNPRPTRAESTDVANAIYDGTSAIMLSGETAAGKYPVESLLTMAKIAERTESDINYAGGYKSTVSKIGDDDVTGAISHATVTTAIDLNAKAIITVTKGGGTARQISKHRPPCPIVGCSPDKKVVRQLNLSWGVSPILIPEKTSTDELFDCSAKAAEDAGLISSGDLCVITAGVPIGVSGTTNLLKVHLTGNILVSGKGIGETKVCSKMCVAKTEEEIAEEFENGDIIVVPQTSNRLLQYMRKARAIVTEAEGVNSHAAIVGMTLGIPVVVGCKNATHILKNGTTVVVDAEKGIVYSGDKIN
ncbi:MAG: pyruvate kinase [Clostridia bacterium]|nr:pyruvate kinase [Clostridia bacterium]